MRFRPLNLVCLAYVLVVLYASLAPFAFEADLGAAAGRFRRA